MRKHPWAAIIGLAVLLSPASLFAVNTKSQTDETEADFQKGELKSTSLSTEGVITIAPALKKLFGTGEAMVWDVAVSPKGDVYIATGHEGKVFKYSAEETTGTLYCDLKEAEATALALSPKGDLYVGASPGGRIYRVRHADRPTTFCATRETYIWDLEFDRDSGDLYAATGTKGRILAIGPDGKSRVYYQSKANNVLSLCKQPKQPLLAATHKPALVLEIPKESEAKVLIDGSPYEEARSVVRGKGGAVYAALNTERSPLEMLRQLAAAAMAAAASGASKPIAGGGGVDRETPSASRPPTMAPPKLPTPKESACQIVKINANGFVQTVWMSPEAPIHCIRY
ncbi:MAG: hypothetical protein NTW86_28390, partial [Candidatus Sumerlaeota bacterium]|nr:hypothetical protein [Candidatus Sumerlaeota bacterium]